MADDDRLARLRRIRREPPPLRPVHLVDRVELNVRMLRLTFEGEGLVELTEVAPASSVRLLVPGPESDRLVIPEWNGNEFLLPGGDRPVLRTFTPLRADGGRIAIEIVRHPGGAVSGWAEQASPGASAAISGPGSGYEFPNGTNRLLVFADETAIPAASQLIAAAPPDVQLDVHLEVAVESARSGHSFGADADVEWHVTEPGAVPGGRLADEARSVSELVAGTYVWAAGEASAMHAIRSHLFDDLGLDRERATVRGYWKPAR